MPRGGHHSPRIRYFIVRNLEGRWQPYRTRQPNECIGKGAEFESAANAQAGAIRWNEMEDRIGKEKQ